MTDELLQRWDSKLPREEVQARIAEMKTLLPASDRRGRPAPTVATPNETDFTQQVSADAK